MTDAVRVRRPLGDSAATATLYYGASCIESLRRLEENSVHCMVTSPPYWGLRDYGGTPQVWGGDPDCDHEWDDEQSCTKCGAWNGQLGLEPTPQMYTQHLVEIFREIRRILREDGTCWLNLGDSYAAGGSGGQSSSSTLKGNGHGGEKPLSRQLQTLGKGIQRSAPPGLKPKDLVGIPWRAAFALQDDGWYLRSEIIWQKPNCLPESVRDRVTRSHEHIFMLTKSARYFYDHDAIKEPLTMTPQRRLTPRSGMRHEAMRHDKKYDHKISDEPHQQGPANGRNKRSVWTVTPKPYKGAHFAVFPPELITPCILAGTSEKGCCPMCGAPWTRIVERPAKPVVREEVLPSSRDGGRTVEQGMERSGMSHFKYNEWLKENPPVTTGWEPTCGCPAHEPVPCKVLDPFSGSGTTGQVALDHGRDYIGLDLNAEYRELAVARLLGEGAPPRETDEGGGILELFGVQEG